MTVAQLGLAVDSSQVDRAAPALDKMAAAAGRAETAAGGMTAASRASSAVMERMLAVLVSMERDLTVVARAAVTEGAAMDTAAAAVRRNTIAHQSNGMAMANSRNLMFQLVDIGQGLPLLFQSMGYGLLNIGNQFSQIGQAYHGQGGMGAALKDMGGLLRPLVPVLLGIGVAVGAVVGVFAGLTTKINETAKTQVTFGNVFMATIQVAAESIGKFFKPAVDNLGGWFRQFVDFLTPLFKGVVNTIVGSFVFGFNAVKDTWSLLPDAFASIFTKAMNGAIDIVQNGINGIVGPINGLLEKVGLQGVPLADLSQFKGKPSNADQKLGGIISADAQSAFNTDYAGQAFSAISQRAQQLAVADAAAKAGKETKKTSDLLKGPLTDGIDKLTAKANVFADAITGAFSNMGTTLVDAFKKGGDVAGNVLSALLDKVGQLGESLLNSGLNSLLGSAVSSIFAPATGGVFGNGLWGTAIFGGARAGGGPVDAGSTYLVGEKGPELFTPGRSGMISPNGAANQNGPSFTINVTVNADSTTNGASVARQVAQELRRQVPDLVAASQRNPYRRSA